MSRKPKRSRQGAPSAASSSNSDTGSAVSVEEKLDWAYGSRSDNAAIPDPPSTWSRRDWIIASLLFAALLVAYLPALHGGPLWDDAGHLTRPDLRSLAGLGRIWFDLRATQQYYPVTHTAFWIEHRLWVDWYPGYHLVNVTLHAISAVLLVRVLRRLGLPGAWLAGALWALHPVQVESVAWMSELKNTLSGVFYFGAALFYLRFDSKRASKDYFAALGLFVLGFLAKSAIDTLPAALLILLYWKRGKINWRTDVRPLLPFFFAAIGSGLVTAGIERIVIGAKGPEFHFTLIDRGLIAGRAIWFYLGKLVWPADLIFSYPRWQIDPSVWWQYLFPASALALAGGLLWLRKLLGRGPAVAFMYFVVMLIPALGFVNIYPFRYSFVADHFQYLASVGPLVLLSAGIEKLRRVSVHFHKLLAPALCTVLLCLLCAATWRQSGNYRDIETLWRATIAGNPNSWLAHNNLGAILLDDGKIGEAISEDRQAMRIEPGFPETYDNLGNALFKAGHTDEAISMFREALRIDPASAEVEDNLGNALLKKGAVGEATSAFSDALKLDPRDANAQNGLGNAFLKEGHKAEAIAAFGEALSLDPANADAHNNIGNTLLQDGRIQEAITQYGEALRSNPSLADAHYNLGDALLQQGEPVKAINEFRDAIRLDPSSADAWYNLGNALSQQGQTEEAISEYRQALNLNPHNAKAHNNLGLALSAQGQTQEAVTEFLKAVDIDPSDAEAHFNLGILLLQQSRIEESVAQFEEDIRIHPSDAAAYENIGHALLKMGHTAEAIDDLKESLNIQPNNPALQNEVAQILATTPRSSTAPVPKPLGSPQ
jgi:protein O-mannosyl-transferase